jgi:trimethylamine:corrinoid methyltransferase-like protein
MSTVKLQELNRIVRSFVSFVFESHAAVFVVQSLQKLSDMTACVQSCRYRICRLVIFDPNKRHVEVKLVLYTPGDVYVMLSFLAWARGGDQRSA